MVFVGNDNRASSVQPLVMDSDTLVQLLHEYDSSLDNALVRAAWENGGEDSLLLRWVKLHMHTGNLLTRDEMEQSGFPHLLTLHFLTFR